MPIGSPLTNSVASVGASGTGYATTTNALLNEMKAAIEGKVPFSALSGSTLDLNNIPITDASYVAFYDQGSAPSAAIAGRFAYANGEMWVVNSTGAIQITSGSGLNAAAIGGIAGDYGSPNPASVQFVDAAWRYDFYDNYTALEYGFVRCAGVDIASGGHVATSNFAKLRYAGSTSLTFTFPDALPVSNRSVLTIDSSGNIKLNDGTNTVTNDLVMAGTTRLREIGRKKTYAFNLYSDRLIGTGSAWSSSEGVNATKGVVIGTVGTGGGVVKQIDGLDVGTTITAINVRIYKQSTGAASCALFKCRDGTVTLAAGFTGGTSSTSGWQNLTLTGTYVVESGYSYHIKAVVGDNNDVLESTEFTYNS